jgi:hypothetical protein
VAVILAARAVRVAATTMAGAVVGVGGVSLKTRAPTATPVNNSRTMTIINPGGILHGAICSPIDVLLSFCSPRLRSFYCRTTSPSCLSHLLPQKHIFITVLAPSPRRPGRPPVTSWVVRQTGHPATVSVHDVDFIVAIAAGHKSDALVVGRSRRVLVCGRVVRQVHQFVAAVTAPLLRCEIPFITPWALISG